jgi:hypothetical protein
LIVTPPAMLQRRLFAHPPPFYQTETYLWHEYCGSGGSVKCRGSQPVGSEECMRHALNKLSKVRIRGSECSSASFPPASRTSAQLLCSILSTSRTPRGTRGASQKPCGPSAGWDSSPAGLCREASGTPRSAAGLVLAVKLRLGRHQRRNARHNPRGAENE